MSDFIQIRKSQIYFYEKTPLYTKTDKGGFVLYKASHLKVDPKRFAADGSPLLFTPIEAQELASKELRAQLTDALLKSVKGGDLKAVKSGMCNIVEEAFQDPLDDSLQILPDSLEIMFEGYPNIIHLIKEINEIRVGGSSLVEHSVNTMVLAINYCVCDSFSFKDTKDMSLAALLHDVGLTKLPKSLIETNTKLSDAQFIEYQKHPKIGYDMVLEKMEMPAAMSMGILEHHERFDGSGYPKGATKISFAGSLIGMLDSFESLTNTEKQHRKRKKPFNALKIVQDEILKFGRHDKTVFRKFCLSLKGKNNFTL